MPSLRTRNGVSYDPAALDRAERRFWRDIWESVPAEVAAERGIELREVGAVQAAVATALPQMGMMNMVLGAADDAPAGCAGLAAATEWAASRGVAPMSPSLPACRDRSGRRPGCAGTDSSAHMPG